MFPRFLIILIISCMAMPVRAQQIIKGLVLDVQTGKGVENVSVTNPDQSLHTITNKKGIFSLKAPSVDSLILVFRHLSYYPLEKEISTLQSNFRIELHPIVVTLDNVSISALGAKKDKNPLNSVIINVKEIERLPAQLGEVDVLKVIEVQPGVFRTSELNSSLNIRGGSGGHNSFILDGQHIFNPNHMLGIMSTFNADLVEQVSLEKNGFHPSLGGSLSSFIQVKNRVGDKNHLTGKVGIGLLSSRLMVEGPIKKGESSFIIGARQSYFDLLAKGYNHIHKNKEGFVPLPKYNFYDLQFKVNTRLNSNWYGEIEAFRSYDNLVLREKRSNSFETDWSNQFFAIHMRYYPNDWFHLSFNSGFGKYGFYMDRDYSDRLDVHSNTSQWNNSLDSELKISSLVTFSAGLFCSSFRYGYTNKLKEGNEILKKIEQNSDAIYSGGYVNSDWTFSENVQVGIGYRLNEFYNGKNFLKGAPRITLKYYQNNWALHLNYSRTYQFNHRIASYGINLPNDIWYPSGKNIKEEKADQLSLGIIGQTNSGLKMGISVYLKNMDNQIDYKEGADLLFSPVDSEILFGKGEARGVEAYLNLIKGKFSGSVNYTLADTWRTFEHINGGEKFHPPFDVTHNLTLVGEFKMSSKWSLSATWYYASGQSTTFPVGAIWEQGFVSDVVDPHLVPVYNERYNFRMCSTHRLDMALRYDIDHSRGHSSLSLGIYNVYNRANPYFVYFDIMEVDEFVNRIVPRKDALIPFLPTFNYTYEFHK